MEPYQRLEVEFANFLGLEPENFVACSSGTAALHLAIEAFRLPGLSGIIVPDFTMVACARAVSMAGCMPIFTDLTSSRKYLTVDPESIVRVVKEQGYIRAVMAVHLYGRQCDTYGIVNGIAPLTNSAKPIILIEDMAEYHGFKPHPNSSAACWSFYKNKVIAGEEGGMCYFKDRGVAAMARSLRSLGFDDQHTFDHLPRGHNYRLANSLASLILMSLREFHRNLNRRRELESDYNQVCPDEWKMYFRQSPWVYDLRIPGLTREKQIRIVQKLNSHGLAARCSFLPMSKQREYSRYPMDDICKREGSYSKLASDEVFYLPLSPGTTCAARLAFGMIEKELDR